VTGEGAAASGAAAKKNFVAAQMIETNSFARTQITRLRISYFCLLH
jgi:hypothetical protein